MKSGNIPEKTSTQEKVSPSDDHSGSFEDLSPKGKVEAPDNSTKKYKPRKDVIEKQRAIATAYFTYKDEHDGEEPDMKQISKMTGISYKTTLNHAKTLGIMK